MTNAEKFLKDNASVEEFADKFITFCMQPTRTKTTSYMEDIKDFLQEKATTTLTEDERVILSSTDSSGGKGNLCRDSRKKDLYIKKYKNGMVWIIDFAMYNHLFQFIKERRRI